MELENKELCENCKGACCKKSGCDYYVEDFESLNIDYLENKLKEGKISVVAALSFNNANSKIVCTPFLYLRARNNRRDVIDLFSFKTGCSVLTKTGCLYSFSERPSGGKNLIPKKDKKCVPLFDQKEKILEWKPYQKVLSRLVKRITGKSVYDNLREDVIKTLYDVLCKNFDGVTREELEDIETGLPLLVKAFPEERKIALQMYKKEYENVLIYKHNKR